MVVQFDQVGGGGVRFGDGLCGVDLGVVLDQKRPAAVAEPECAAAAPERRAAVRDVLGRRDVVEHRLEE